MARTWASGLGSVACLLVATVARAECAMDNDCAGELICEEGACVAPAPVNQRHDAAPARARVVEPTDSEPDESPARRRKGKRHSTAMMVGGIVMTSLAPVGLLLGTAGMLGGKPELFVGGWVSTAVLAGVGIPLIVIGGRRKPVTTGYAVPWVAPQSAGLQLRFSL